MAIITAIAGKEQCDIVFYLSEVYKAMKKHVLLIDNSYSKDLFEALKSKLDDEVIERGYVTCAKDIDYSYDAFSYFDVVIFYEGLNPSVKNILNSSKVFIITDYSESIIRQIKTAFNSEGVNCSDSTEFYYILRDKISKKIRDKVAFSLFGMEACRLAGAIPFSNVDYYKYIDFSHNKAQTVRGISEGMKEALVFMIMELEKIERKDALKIINRA